MTLLVNLSYVSQVATGISTYSSNLLNALSFLDFDVLSSIETTTGKHHFVPSGMTPEFGAKGHLRRLAWVELQLPRIYRQLNSSLLFSPLPEAPLYANCRYIVTVHDLIPRRFPDQFPWSQKFYSYYYIPEVLSKAEHILCDSEATAQDVMRFFKLPEQKLTIIPLACDTHNFQFLNLPTRNYFLFVGRINPYKNVQRIIEAFAALPNRTDYELWMVGPTDPRYLPALVEQVKSLDVEQQVKFLDYVAYEELPVLINQAIALVFPSLWEGFGLPVLEAMSCGTPVVTSNVASLPEVAGDAALLVNPYNVNEITDAMRAVATDAKLRSRLRQEGLTRARQFSWTKTGQATAKVLQRYL